MWWVGSKGHVGESLGLLRIESVVILPEEISGDWSVWDETSRLWVKQAGIIIETSIAYKRCNIRVQMWPSHETREVCSDGTLRTVRTFFPMEDGPSNFVSDGDFCILGGANKAGTVPLSKLTDGCLDVIFVPTDSSRVDLAASYRALKAGKAARPPVQYKKTTGLQIIPFAERGIFLIDSQIYSGSPIELQCYRQVASFVTSVALHVTMEYQESSGFFSQWRHWRSQVYNLNAAAQAAWMFSCQTTQRLCAGNWRKTAAILHCQKKNLVLATEQHINRQRLKQLRHQRCGLLHWISWSRRRYDNRCAMSMALRFRRAFGWHAIKTAKLTLSKIQSARHFLCSMQSALVRTWDFLECRRRVQWWTYNTLLHKEFRLMFSAPEACSVKEYIIACCNNPSQAQIWNVKGHVGSFTTCWPAGLAVYDEVSDSPSHIVQHLETGQNVAISSIGHFKDACLMGHVTGLGWLALTTRTGMPCVIIRNMSVQVEEARELEQSTLIEQVEHEATTMLNETQTQPASTADNVANDSKKSEEQSKAGEHEKDPESDKEEK